MVDVVVIANLNSRRNRKDKNRIKKLRDVIGDKGEVFPTKSIDDVYNKVVPYIRTHKPPVVACDSGDGGLVPLVTELIKELGNGSNQPSQEHEKQNESYFPLIAPTAGGTQNVFSKRCGLTSEKKVFLYLEEIVKTSRDELFIENIDLMKIEDDRKLTMYGFTFGLGMPVTLLEEYYKKKDMRYAQVAWIVTRLIGSYISYLIKSALHLNPNKEDFFYAQRLKNFYERMNTKTMVSINGNEPEEFLGIMAQTITSIGIKGSNIFYRAEKAQGQFHVVGTKANIKEFAVYLPVIFTGNFAPIIKDHLDLQTSEVSFVSERPFGYQVNGELEYQGRRLQANKVALKHGRTLNIVKTKNTP